MGMSIKEVGGGPATGLADSFVTNLQALLNGGGIGTAGAPDAVGSTGNIMNVLSDILSAGGGKAGNAISDLLNKQQERDVAGLRERFGATGLGTPGAYAESLYKGTAAPNITNAITNLQLSALSPILQSIYGLSQKGIAQRQLIQQQSGLGQAISTIAPIAKTALSFVNPAFSTGLPPAPTIGPLDPGSVQVPSFN